MANYGTVLFDMDGTLLNTLDDIGDSVNFYHGPLRIPAKIDG